MKCFLYGKKSDDEDDDQEEQQIYCSSCMDEDCKLAIRFFKWNGINFFDEDVWHMMVVWEEEEKENKKNDGDSGGDNDKHFIVHLYSSGIDDQERHMYFVGGPNHKEIAEQHIESWH